MTCYNRAVRWDHMLTDKAKKKFEILVFWEKHGLQATMDAFHVKRRTLFPLEEAAQRRPWKVHCPQ